MTELVTLGVATLLVALACLLALWISGVPKSMREIRRSVRRVEAFAIYAREVLDETREVLEEAQAVELVHGGADVLDRRHVH